MKLSIFCDGGARGNPGPAAAAFVIKDETDKILHQQGFYLGVATNNQAEYSAVLKALEWVSEKSSNSEIIFYLDSLLVVNQLKGSFKVKDPILKNENLKIKKLNSKFKLQISNFVYIPRSQNFLADKIVNETLDAQ